MRQNKRLCQLNMNILRKLPQGMCLWKNLWNLWKSLIFSQQSQNIPQSHHGKMLHIFLHKPSEKTLENRLRNQGYRVLKKGENVEKVGKSPKRPPLR